MDSQYSGIANINGEMCSLLEAKIPLSDRGFLFGHSIFETLLVKNGKIVSWDYHFERMLFSCQEAFIKSPNKELLLEWAQNTVNENIKKSGFINKKTQLRIIISGGNSFDLSIKKDQQILPKSNVIIICRNVAGPSQENYLIGIKLKCMPDLRAPALVNIKSCSYLYNLISLENAKKNSFDDALFYNSKNVITESTTANFIWFDENFKVMSHAFQGNCLAGITLTRLITGLEKAKIVFDWNELNRTNIASVMGCAIISSIRGIVPVRQIDEYKFDTHTHNKFFEKLSQALQSEES
ncbi:aminotransferase class IV [Silvanigrella aquatica]|uniref:Aminodeoxychorismate lyase n=1 Tax=Silvanigrella aquatica TaxID=1915309 RepID=A0A1L4CY82_9BACT|nr:aminotransferase class IV [Silvanigrella aquatica]APJ02906.1 hypothetical protein AXG55_02795 [Silvanigrella aquatica]